MTDKKEAFALAYAAAIQGCCQKYGAVLKADRESMAEFCLWAAARAANDFSRFFPNGDPS